ncbi:hypothetical protein DZS_22900 [Dickeya ananatis]
MSIPASPTPQLPLSAEQLSRLQAATGDLSPAQLAWLSGYFWGVIQQQPGALAAPTSALASSNAAPPAAITLISASQTGNARRVAEQVRDELLAANLPVTLVNAGDYKFKQIAQEKTVADSHLDAGRGRATRRSGGTTQVPVLEKSAIAGGADIRGIWSG